MSSLPCLMSDSKTTVSEQPNGEVLLAERVSKQGLRELDRYGPRWVFPCLWEFTVP
jgi:hypothetical protein